MSQCYSSYLQISKSASSVYHTKVLEEGEVVPIAAPKQAVLEKTITKGLEDKARAMPLLRGRGIVPHFLALLSQ